MGSTIWTKSIENAITMGLVTEATVTQSLRRGLKQLFLAGRFDEGVWAELGAEVRQLRHHFGHFFRALPYFLASHAMQHPMRAVRRTLLSADAYWMLTGARNPMVWPIHALIRGLIRPSTRPLRRSRRRPASWVFSTWALIQQGTVGT